MKLTFYKTLVIVLVFWTLFTMFIFSRIRTRLDDVELQVADASDSGGILSSLSEIRESLLILSDKLDRNIFSQKYEGTSLPPPSKYEEKDEESRGGSTNEIPIVIFTYQRDQYLRRCLDNLFSVMPEYSRSKFPVYISQDGDSASVVKVVKSFGNKIAGHFIKEHTAQFENPMKGPKAYYFISQNYEFGLKKVFNENPNYKSVIILEEDLEVSNDFLEYMDAMEPLLEEDHTLFCASAFHDNGLPEHVDNPLSLFRSDFFPGLGWLLPRRIWEEFDGKGWPIGFWDDWIRLPENRNGRACIRPEISRTYTFGEKGGASKGQFSHFLNNIQLDSTPINWAKVDLSFLKKENYDPWLDSIIASAQSITFEEIGKYDHQKKNLKIMYTGKSSFISLAKKCHIMDDEKSNVPRGAYKGVVSFKLHGNNVFLVPSKPDLLYSN